MNKFLSIVAVVSLVQITIARLTGCRTFSVENWEQSALISAYTDDKSKPVAHLDNCDYKMVKPETRPLPSVIVRCKYRTNTDEYAKTKAIAEDNYYTNDLEYVEDSVAPYNCETDMDDFYVKKVVYNFYRDVCPPEKPNVPAVAADKLGFEIGPQITTNQMRTLIGSMAGLTAITKVGSRDEIRGLSDATVAQYVIVKRPKEAVWPTSFFFRVKKADDNKIKIPLCFSNGDHIYFIRYYTPKTALSQDVRTAFKAKSPADRIKGYVEMVTKVKEFVEKYKFLDAGMLLSSFAYDDQNKLFIVPSYDLRRVGDTFLGSPTINQHYLTKGEIYRPTEFDPIYTIALCIVSLEHGGDINALWSNKWGTTTAIENSEDEFPVNNLTDSEQRLNTIVKGVLGPVWGDADKATNPPTAKSLTSLVLWVINHAPKTYTFAEFIVSLGACVPKRNRQSLALV